MTTTIIGLVLTAMGMMLGILYFISNRRYAEAREAREELRAIQKDQDVIKERMAVIEKTAEYLKESQDAACRNTDQHIASLAQLWRDIHTDLKHAVQELQRTITTVQVDQAKKSV